MFSGIVFSFIIHVLMLSMSMYSTGFGSCVIESVGTLPMLSIIMVVIFVVISALMIVRSFIFLHVNVGLMTHFLENYWRHH